MIVAEGLTARPTRGRVRLGEVAAVLGGAALLTGSWLVVAAEERVPEWEARLFSAVNDAPDALWPIVWVPMQLGSLAGSLIVSAATGAASRNVRLGAAALVGTAAADGRCAGRSAPPGASSMKPT